MANRVGKPPLKGNKNLKSEGKGAMDGCTSTDGKMCLVNWNDNNVVHMLSSAYDWKGDVTLRRWDKTSQQMLNFNCPLSIIQYNHSMGGVNLLDFLMSLYRIHIKSRKWTLRVIFHFIDLCVVVSYQMYIRDCKLSKVDKKKQMTLRV